ncbi:uncharacterized protein LOC121866121, partial [Homarus americanus]|uniref:uncharacterized protein LOC121866121 n=1 Tax=Homarus americanus TaxID=6706 RepID=UPI001C462501
MVTSWQGAVWIMVTSWQGTSVDLITSWQGAVWIMITQLAGNTGRDSVDHGHQLAGSSMDHVVTSRKQGSVDHSNQLAECARHLPKVNFTTLAGAGPPKAMFTWWISWVWAWVLWSSWAYVGVGAMWAAGIHQQEAAGSPGAAVGVKKDVQLGPGMGGSAIQIHGREGAQHFATQPTPQTAVVGSTAVLPCRVINKVGHLQWTKDGFGLGTERDLFGFTRYAMIGSDDEGDFSLRIQPVLLDDDALYQCQVSASDGVPGIRSHTARLTVYVPPDHP